MTGQIVFIAWALGACLLGVHLLQWTFGLLSGVLGRLAP